MPIVHPQLEGLEALVEHLPGEERRLLHHAVSCAGCRQALLQVLAEEDAVHPSCRVLPWRGTEHDYGRTIDEVLRAFRPRISAAARDQAEGPALLAELLRHPAERRDVLIANSERFRSLALCDLLLRQSREESYQDARVGEELARLGLEVADRLDPVRFGDRVLEDVRARGWALVANARRILSDLHGSEEAFAIAEKHLKGGTRDRLELARLLGLKASLRRSQRRCGEASSLLKRAVTILLEAGETHLAGEMMVARAIACKEAGRLDEAIDLLREAAAHIDTEADPRLDLCARHNLIDWLVEDGRVMEAQALLAKSRGLYRRFPDPRTQLRLLWVRGKIARGLGQLAAAADLFTRVRDGLIEQGIGYDAAVVSLDLAGVCAQLGRTVEMKRLAGEMLPIFRSRDVHREAMAALIVFQQALMAEQATLGLVEEISSYLRRAAADPALPFERRG